MTKIEDYAKYWSRRSARRNPSAIRVLNPLSRVPGMISLGAGNPNKDTFPFEQVTIKLKSGSEIPISGTNLIAGLEYSNSYGITGLVEWLHKHQIEAHSPPYSSPSDVGILCTNGTQDAMNLAFDMLLNEGDSILTDLPTYTGALAALAPYGCKIQGVETDGDGMIPQELSKVLTTWDISSSPFPRVLYTIPTGQNPSGCTISQDRRAEIYKIACENDIIIIEDDPYYYLSFSENRLKSFLSMDVEGRVIRLDSFSKILAGGLRLGWVTGHVGFVERMQLHTQVVSVHASGMSQAIAWNTLQAWDKDGWEGQLANVRKFYKERRDIFVSLAEKHLKGLAVWNVPVAGMFLWIKLLGVSDTRALILEKAVEAKVLLLPGQFFMPDNSASPYVRASFSTATPEQMDEALSRLASLLKDHLNTAN
eukprot:TRINITY_DN9987_c0_g1_i1.p1 TRINITY_DN9987_c0_g1~~TRINITY_DN9987_c0_g1_i1.p1  ORF type:complete len:422 (-),score=106.45 TRINITY_DN9987_c0_g1_i1:25-1290(-)